jgi:predicted nucleotidyltransferase component of viral defense system
MMESIVQLPARDFEDLVTETAARLGVHPAIVEKDIWVCTVLERIFTDDTYRDHFVFKGGTSLSKVYNVIHRFSEDIDLILDWRLLGYGEAGDNTDLEMPSRTKQDRLNKEVDAKGGEFIAKALLPWLAEQMSDISTVRVALSESDSHILDVYYSSVRTASYLPDRVRLEIGPLAAWIPSSRRIIVPYVVEYFESVVGRTAVPVRVTSAERTFWEKATILHQQAHTPGDVPPRYARHYYDLYMLAESKFADGSLSDLELLRHVVEFKDRFYHSAAAHYELAKPGTFRLIPEEAKLRALDRDYREMQVMFFSHPPAWEVVVSTLSSLEERINGLEG